MFGGHARGYLSIGPTNVPLLGGLVLISCRGRVLIGWGRGWLARSPEPIPPPQATTSLRSDRFRPDRVAESGQRGTFVKSLARSLQTVLLSVLGALVLATGARAGALGGVASAALDALLVVVGDPGSCPQASTCSKARISFEKARALQGDSSRALSEVAKGIGLLEKAGLVSGPLGDAVQALAAAMNGEVAMHHDLATDQVEQLCSSVRSAALKKFVKPEVELQRAQALLSGGAWSLGLKSLSKAEKGLDSGERTTLAQAARCRPKPCVGGGYVAFTPGPPGNPSLTLIPIDKGTNACFQIDGLLELAGTICFAFQSLSRFAFAGDLASSDETVSLNGTSTLTSCTDSAGWVRVSKVALSLSARSPELGSGRGRASFSAMPPTVSFLGSLLPVPPGALELRVGDVMEEPQVHLAARVISLSASATCSARHEVVAIEPVSVLAGVFTAARVDSTVSCDAVVDGEIESSVLTATTWLASEVGQVRVEVEEDGSPLIALELSSYQIP